MIASFMALALLVSFQSPNVTNDVPPIQQEYGNPGHEYCDMGQCEWLDDDPKHPSFFGSPGKRRTRETCADKTHFLMTSEDGRRHCIAIGVPSGWVLSK